MCCRGLLLSGNENLSDKAVISENKFFVGNKKVAGDTDVPGH